MATIKIAESTRPGQDGVSSNVQESVYAGRARTRSDRTTGAEAPDDIYNIRDRSIRAPSLGEKYLRRTETTDREDDDPGLSTPADFKQKQVCSSPSYSPATTALVPPPA